MAVDESEEIIELRASLVSMSRIDAVVELKRYLSYLNVQIASLDDRIIYKLRMNESVDNDMRWFNNVKKDMQSFGVILMEMGIPSLS